MDRTGLEIAVIGAAGVFPGASRLAAFWENLRNGTEAITFFSKEELRESGIPPETIAAVDYVRAAGVLEDYDKFDTELFNLDNKAAELIDPQQRLMLECCWHALEDAGYLSDAPAQHTGVFCAASPNTYFLWSVLPRLRSGDCDAFAAWTQNQAEHLPSVISRLLRLTGPSIAVETGSSSSLAAVHLACQSLLAGDSDMALAGGVCVLVPHRAGYRHQSGSALSPDGHCRAFDSGASGTVPGSGAGIIVLKRLADAVGDRDSIYCIIRGTALNHNGAATTFSSSSSISGLAEVVTRAHLFANVSADTVRYVEAHGSGIVTSDAAELASLRHAFGKGATRRCAIGSVKTNIGHLHAAAGIASMIKTILALKHGLIPPTLHFRHPHPTIGLDDSPFYVNSQAEPWEEADGLRRAGVISIGRGGTNAYVVLESVSGAETTNRTEPERAQLLVLSALNEAAVEDSLTNLAASVENSCPGRLSDISFTLQSGRTTLPHRAFAVCRKKLDLRFIKADAQRTLRATPAANPPRVVFLFPGIGDHYVNMGRGLYQSEPVFRREIDYCADVLRPILESDLRDHLYPRDETHRNERQPDFRNMVRGRNPVGGDTLDETVIAHPAVFSVEYALGRMWMSWGVTPMAMVGHSLGEYVAACLAGVFRLEDALQLVLQRARMIAQVGAGAMLAVSMGAEEMQSLLGPGLWLSAHNGAELCTVAGLPQAITLLSEQLTAAGVACRPVAAEHAFHSGMLEPIRAALESCVAAVPRQAPTIPYISNVTGQWVLPAEAIDPAHWARHSCQTVRFAEALDVLAEEPDLVLLEVGPGYSLSAFAQQHAAQDGKHTLVSTLRSRYESGCDREYVLNALGKLWACGVQPLWDALHEGEDVGRVSLPGYSFQRQRCLLPPLQAPVALEGIVPFMLMSECTDRQRALPSTISYQSNSPPLTVEPTLIS